MYAPKHFIINDWNLISAFIKKNGFATIISTSSEYPIASHIPLELEEAPDRKPILRGHLANANPQAELLVDNAKVLVIFQSPVHHYISASWYEKPDAPTWNYQSIHIKGTISLLSNSALYESIQRLTNRYEVPSRNPVRLEELPQTIQGQLSHVLGVEINIVEVSAVFKLSQNRSIKDVKQIIDNLHRINDGKASQMAAVMEVFTLNKCYGVPTDDE